MFTKQQLEQLETLMRVVVSDETEKVIDKKLDEKIKYLPTKEEFYKRMDKLSGDLKKNGEAQNMITGRHTLHATQLENHEKRMKKIERTLNLS